MPPSRSSAIMNDDWKGVSDLTERRRIQNRIAQRKYRKKREGKLKRAEHDNSPTSTSSEQSFELYSNVSGRYSHEQFRSSNPHASLDLNGGQVLEHDVDSATNDGSHVAHIPDLISGCGIRQERYGVGLFTTPDTCNRGQVNYRSSTWALSSISAPDLLHVQDRPPTTWTEENDECGIMDGYGLRHSTEHATPLYCKLQDEEDDGIGPFSKALAAMCDARFGT